MYLCVKLSWKLELLSYVHTLHSLSVCLSELFEAQKVHKLKSWQYFCVWLSPKRNFLKKVAFWAQAKPSSKTRFIYGPLRSINENA